MPDQTFRLVGCQDAVYLDILAQKPKGGVLAENINSAYNYGNSGSNNNLAKNIVNSQRAVCRLHSSLHCGRSWEFPRSDIRTQVTGRRSQDEGQRKARRRDVARQFSA
ncbi:uncharacterized protein [Drosophila takahashii]|uniref:uncharacterized protein n=1 Tax=Drosophila takahashii TaxID=29030 RepID=UPI0038992DF9